MKHKILTIAYFIISICFTTKQINAQDVDDDLKTGKNYYALKLMLNSGSSTYKYTNAETDNEKGRLGYGIGLDYMKALGEKTFLSMGGEINSRGYLSSSSLGTSRVRATYLDIPVTLNFITGDRAFFSYHDKFLIGVGAYAGIGIMGKYKVPNGSWTNLKFGESNTSNRSRLDYGWIFNFGYKTEGLPFLIFSYAAGLKNVLPADNHGAYDWRKLSCFKMYLFVPIEKKSKFKYPTYKKR